MKANLDMGNFKIHNVKNDDNEDGVVNKGYVDKADNNHVQMSSILNTEKLSNPTPVNLNMSNNNIINLKYPKNNSDASNRSYVDNNIKNVDTKISNLVLDGIETEKRIKKYVDESHITSSTSFKDEFRYLMKDVDDSSSESDIRVTGIPDLAESPHTFNKKAYDLLLFKDAQNNYISRIGFNLYRIPEGEYTICIEFFFCNNDKCKC